ncbi:MAG: hypothetical protein ACK5SX_05625 [Sandaracinobacter sp.]
MFQPTLAPFPVAFSLAGFLFGATMAGLALLLRSPSASKPDPRHAPEAWARAGVFGLQWPRPVDGSANAALVLMILLAAGFAGSAVPRLANSMLDRSAGQWHVVEVVDADRVRSAGRRRPLPDRHFAVVASPAPPHLPVRVPIIEPDGDIVGMCIGMRVHPGVLNAPWYQANTAPRPCPDQGSSSDESP